MIINIVVPKLHKEKYTGGILCIFEYAHQLHVKGHHVNMIPAFPSDKPLWFKKPFGHLISTTKTQLLGRILKQSVVVIASIVKLEIIRNPFLFRKKTSSLFSSLLILTNKRFYSTNIENGLMQDYLSEVIPKADHTIATIYQTASVVKARGSGNTWYFCQHYEPYFSNESDSPEFAYIDAISSYHIGLNLIANSAWLYNKLREETSSQVFLSPNAIDHNIFNGEVKNINDSKNITLISYGGREAKWKGFIDMAKAVKISRESLPEYNIEWKVYGDALLPEENEIACYQSLGFLNSKQLSQAYRSADILLSASWYESFPLFPIEAMACGLPVITTSKGTEDYAMDRNTVLIVKEKKPKSIASAIIELATDPKLRFSIAQEGKKISKKFTWEKSGNKLQEILESA